MLDGTVRQKIRYIRPYIRYILNRCCRCKVRQIVKQIKGVTNVRNEGKGDCYKWRSFDLIPSRARINFLFTNMSIRIVSGLRLARRREIVSRPPENILSTATADPLTKRILIININREWLRSSTWNGEDITCKAREVRELGTSPMPPLKWIARFEVLLRKTPKFH